MSHHHTYHHICHHVWHLISGSTNIKYSKIVSKAYTFSSSRGFWMEPIWAKINQNLHVKQKLSASGTGPPLPQMQNLCSDTPLIHSMGFKPQQYFYFFGFLWYVHCYIPSFCHMPHAQWFIDVINLESQEISHEPHKTGAKKGFSWRSQQQLVCKCMYNYVNISLPEILRKYFK